MTDAARATRWLFSAPIDLAVFGGTAVIALALVLARPARGARPPGGAIDGAPEWTWITGVLLIDVAHI